MFLWYLELSVCFPIELSFTPLLVPPPHPTPPPVTPGLFLALFWQTPCCWWLRGSRDLSTSNQSWSPSTSRFQRPSWICKTTALRSPTGYETNRAPPTGRYTQHLRSQIECLIWQRWACFLSESRFNYMFQLGGTILAPLTVDNVFTVLYCIFLCPQGREKKSCLVVKDGFSLHTFCMSHARGAVLFMA